MSKRLSVFARLLAVIMCLALVLAGCNAANLDSNGGAGNSEPKTPEAQLAYSIDKTVGAIMGADSTLNVLDKVLNKGKITVSAMGMVENVLYIDSGNSYLADFLTANMYGEELDLSVYLKDSAIALALPAVLGEGTYGVNLDTLASDLKDSAVWALMGTSYEEYASQSGLDMDALADSVTGAMDSVGELEAAIEEAAKNIKVESAEGKAVVYGTEVDAIIITTSLTTADVKAVLDAAINWLETKLAQEGDAELDSVQSDPLAEMKDALNEAFAEVDLEFVITANIHPETEYLMSCAVNMAGTVDGDAGEMSMELVLGVDPTTSDRYTQSVSFGAEGEEPEMMEAVLTRQLGESEDVYTLSVSAIESEETTGGATFEATKVFSGSFTYNKESHEFVINVEADGEETGITGKFQSDEDSLELYIDTVESYSEEMEVDISVTLEVIDASELPEMPEYTNILQMTEEELSDLMEQFSGSAESEEYYE